MIEPRLRPAGPLGSPHPDVLGRRVRDALVIGLAGVLLPAALTLGLTIGLPKLRLLTVLAIIAGLVAVVALMQSERLEVTVTLLAVYLLMLDGPVKLLIGAREATAAAPDVLVGAVGVGALVRMLLRRERMRMPPLAVWVLAFIGIAVVEAFNPKTLGFLKALAGFRQELQWVPFFFFGYVLMRSKGRLRRFFVIVCVCAVANGIVAAYQTGLSPQALASWGPGYRTLYEPTTVEGVTVTTHVAASKRSYESEGEAHVRPAGLGSDSGFSGGVGDLALPFSLALLATWPRRKRWVAVALALGSMVAIATGLGRLQVASAGLAVASFIVFASLAGGGRRAAAAALAVLALAIPFGVGFVTILRSGTFARYASFENNSAGSLATYKAGAYTLLPHQLSVAPFGVGLGTVGAVGAFGGEKTTANLVEGNTVSAETQYNLLADELGLPGLALWAALSLYFVLLVGRGMRGVRDRELAILLAGACAPFLAQIIEGFNGPFSTSAAQGPYFWFVIGMGAYWFASHRRIPVPRISIPTTPSRLPA